MYSFLICDLSNELDKKEIYKIISKDFQNADINFLCSGEQEELSNDYNVIVFDNFVSDDIAINSYLKELKYDKIIITRKGFKDFENLHLFKNQKEDVDIAMFKKYKKESKNKFVKSVKDFCHNLFLKAVDYSFYEGNISAIYFNKSPTKVLKEMDNPAPFTKVNKWVGIKVEYLTKDIPKFKPQITFSYKWKNFYFASCLFLVFLLVSIFCFKTFNFILNLLFVSIDIILFFISLFFLFRVYIFSKIGKIENRKCKYIKKNKGEENGKS